jgi:hypothetical protein
VKKGCGKQRAAAFAGARACMKVRPICDRLFENPCSAAPRGSILSMRLPRAGKRIEP